jgi:hypothetical protein
MYANRARTEPGQPHRDLADLALGLATTGALAAVRAEVGR